MKSLKAWLVVMVPYSLGIAVHYIGRLSFGLWALSVALGGLALGLVVVFIRRRAFPETP